MINHSLAALLYAREPMALAGFNAVLAISPVCSQLPRGASRCYTDSMGLPVSGDVDGGMSSATASDRFINLDRMLAAASLVGCVSLSAWGRSACGFASTVTHRAAYPAHSSPSVIGSPGCARPFWLIITHLALERRPFDIDGLLG